jgi:hypothetical protein
MSREGAMPDDTYGHDTPDPAYGWTIETLRVYNEALRREHEKFEVERDRRYAEVKQEQEKALKIKETADLAALGLAREIQTYKDEKANELREQINSERNLYVTKSELESAIRELNALIAPLTGLRSQNVGSSELQTRALAVFSALVAVGVLIVLIIHG